MHPFREIFTQANLIDNGVLTSKYFMSQVISNNQWISFSGFVAIHHNVVFDRGIQTILNMDFTILFRMPLENPQGTTTSDHWLMYINHDIWLYN